MPNILTNPFIWVALFAVVFLLVMVTFLAYVFQFAAQRNQPERETLKRKDPLQPLDTSTLQKMTKVIFNWRTILAVGVLVLIAYVISNYTSVLPDWQTAKKFATDAFWWVLDFSMEYGIWIIVVVPLYLAAVGYNQNKMKRSYTGDALYYVLGGAAVIGGIALVVLGKNLLLGAVAQSRDKTRATFECWYIETTLVDCDTVSQITAPSIDWGVIVLCLFGAAFLGGLWKMNGIQQTTALGSTVIVLPFILWLAWGALPTDFKEDVSSITASIPFVETEAERAAAAAAAQAKEDAANLRRFERAQERERLRKLSLAPKETDCTARAYQAFTNCKRVTLRAGGEPYVYVKSNADNCPNLSDRDGLVFDQSGIIITVQLAVGEALKTFHVFERTPGQSYKGGKVCGA